MVRYDPYTDSFIDNPTKETTATINLNALPNDIILREVVEVSDESIDKIADAVVRKLADHKTEPQTERIKTHDYCDICNHKGCGNCIANNLDDYCVPSGYEPTTQMKTQNSNLAFEKRTMRDCYNCKRYETEGECIECNYEPNNFDKDINVRSKTEPKLSEIPTSKCHYEPKTDCPWK